METNEILIGCSGLLTTVASGVISWLSAKKKYYTEVDSNYIDNLSKGLETYDSIISHNKEEIEYLMRENEELRKEVAELRKQVLNLTMNLTYANRAIEELKNRKPNEKDKNRLDETKGSSRRRPKSVKEE
ncbi:MAG: hypothetical protein K2G70_00470 [Turicibacter sp.]|nr:hypothetical protein [Turicibacter sp.]